MVIELVAAGAAGCLVYWAVRRDLSPVSRRIRSTPRFTVATVPEVTQARLVGVALALDDATITAPLTGRPCLCYVARMRVTEGTSMTNTQQAWEANRELGGVRFELVDDSGAAIVDPDAAEGALVMKKVPESDRTAAFCARYKLATTGVVDFFEGIIELHQRISIAGFGQREGTRLVMRSSPHLPLAISNLRGLAR